MKITTWDGPPTTTVAVQSKVTRTHRKIAYPLNVMIQVGNRRARPFLWHESIMGNDDLSSANQPPGLDLVLGGPGSPNINDTDKINPVVIIVENEIKIKLNYREQPDFKCCLRCVNSDTEMDYDDMDLLCYHEDSGDDDFIVGRLDICDNYE